MVSHKQGSHLETANQKKKQRKVVSQSQFQDPHQLQFQSEDNGKQIQSQSLDDFK